MSLLWLRMNDGEGCGLWGQAVSRYSYCYLLLATQSLFFIILFYLKKETEREKRGAINIS